MATKRITSEKQIMQYLDDEISAYEAQIIQRLSYMGEQCIIHARSLPSPQFSGIPRSKIPSHQPNYIDWTQNLRGSIGYIITVDGRIVVGGKFDESKEGGRQGRKFAEELASEFPRGIVLIVVAGMKYAAYVEAKGYDVLTSSEILAEREVPKLLAKLNLYKQ